MQSLKHTYTKATYNTIVQVMIHYPKSVISHYLHVIMVVSSVMVTQSKAHFEVSHPQIKCRSVSTEDWDLSY